MRKITKRLSFLLALLICLTLAAPAFASDELEDVTDIAADGIADEAEAEIADVTEAPVTDGETYSGTCGANVRWSLNTDTGALTISGTGAMMNYEWSNPAPWYSYRTSIKTATVQSGVTTIVSYAFYECPSLTDVYYDGSAADWAAITVGEYNEPLLNATIHYNAAAPSSSPFTDVPDTVSYYKYVMWAYNNGIVKGTSATTFSPKGSVTRGQIVLMLYRMAGKPTVTNTMNPFTDVKKSDACYKAVLWAVEQGITKGTSATTFSPNKNCTRYQLVTFLYRFNDLMRYI